MLITPIWPKVSVRPSAASSRSAPVRCRSAAAGSVRPRALALCAGAVCGCGAPGTRGCLPQATRNPASGWGGRSARGFHELVADVRREPVVALEERVGLDGLVGGPDDVELVVWR